MLTKQEKEDFDKLRFGFNVYKEEVDYDVKVSQKFEIARPFSKKLLTVSLYLNIASLLFYFLSLVLTITKPAPDLYGSTPNGKIYPLQKVQINQGK